MLLRQVSASTSWNFLRADKHVADVLHAVGIA